MFLVAIIPGPHEPSLGQINHVLVPVVSQLGDLWMPGVSYSHTASSNRPIRIQVALIPLVCDVPAARAMSGFRSATSEQFCPYCNLPLASINNLDVENWGHRKLHEHRSHAEAWKNAATDDERNKLWKQHGIRYTELLRLPYWDPTSYVVIDTMHNLFLGNFQDHCRNIWGMDAAHLDGDGSDVDP
ncbi:hypothetical protein FA95DRAFT_1454680, partial [Auriscalpium vulgare]